MSPARDTGAPGYHTEQERIALKTSYDSLSVNEQLIWNLRDIGGTMRRIREGRGSQRRILILLRESGSTTQRALTERLGIQPGSASEVIGKLEAAGLIRRTPSTADRRTSDICLTETGAAAAEEAFIQREACHRQMFACLSPEEQAALLGLLERINASWGAYNRKNGAGPETNGERST